MSSSLAPFVDEPEVVLDCSGADSASSECWPAIVNIGVPIVISALFVAVLAVMYIFWPLQAASDSYRTDYDDMITAEEMDSLKTNRTSTSISTGDDSSSYSKTTKTSKTSKDQTPTEVVVIPLRTLK